MAAALMDVNAVEQVLLPQLQQQQQQLDLQNQHDTEDAHHQEASGDEDDAPPLDDSDALDTDAHDDEDDHDDTPSGVLPGGKSASLARAVGKILATAAAKGGHDVVLAGSKSSAKRAAEEDAADAGARESKRLRKELKTRGRSSVPKQGQDPQHDAKERALARVATRGVVQLFNAITKAQRAQKDALLSGVKQGSVSKAEFLTQLKAGGAAGRAAASSAADPKPTWEVLQDSFSGLRGRSKMKDWDLAESGSEGEDFSDLGDDSDVE